MNQRMFALGLGLALLWAFPEFVSAQPLTSDERRTYEGERRFETSLVVDARPLQAQVSVDGRPLGLASELVARAIAVTPGGHTIEISAPGFHGYSGRFVADSRGSVNQFVVTLVPQ